MAQSIKNVIFKTSFTRPSNTTTYAANQAVNATGVTTNLSFTTEDGLPINIGSSYIIRTARLVCNSTTTTNGTFTLFLFDTATVGYADGSPRPLLFSEKASRFGQIAFTLATGGSGSDCAESFVKDLNISIRPQTTSIKGDLVATAAYVPTSAEQFYIEITAEQLDA